MSDSIELVRRVVNIGVKYNSTTLMIESVSAIDEENIALNVSTWCNANVASGCNGTIDQEVLYVKLHDILTAVI